MVLDVMRALGRRWYVVLAGLLLTAGLVFAAYKANPPEYNARALLLVIPSKGSLGKGGNPLLQLSGLEQPASVVAAYFASEPALAEVAQLSPTAEFEVALDDSTRGPVIAVDVTDKTAANTLRVLDYLRTRIPSELQRLQEEADARNGTFVGTMLLVADGEAKPDIHGTLRITIAALVVGLVGTGISAFAIDGIMQRRRLSKLPPGVAGGEGETDDAVPEGVTEEVAATDRPGYVPGDGASPEVGTNGRRLSKLPPGVAGGEGKTDDAVPEGVTEEVAATDRPGYVPGDGASPEVGTDGRRLSRLPPGVAGGEGKTDDAVPEGVTEEVAATDRPGYVPGDGASPEVGTNAPFDMWPEAPWATEDARGFDTVPPGRRIRREP